MGSSRRYRWLAIGPPLFLLVGVPLANGVELYVLGLPFLLFWIVAGIALTSATLGLIAALDHRRDALEERERAPRHGEA